MSATLAHSRNIWYLKLMLRTASYSRFYITASSHPSHHRILKIDRTTPETLTVTEDHASYDAKELEGVLRMVDDGNRSAGGLEKVLDFQ